jgi:hypothetical protein
MGVEIPWETRCAAEDMYITDGLTYDQIAEKTGVSISQLKRWGKQGKWMERKREHRESLSRIKRDTVLLRSKLISQAMKSLDPQDVYAAARMEQVAASAAKLNDVQSPELIPADINIETPQDAIAKLELAMQHRIARMAGGKIDLAGVKQIQQCLELIDKLKSKYIGPDDNQKKTLTSQQLKEIREQLKL